MHNPIYLEQAKLLIQCLPEINKHDCFALKGGTAINLFIQDMPRLSVDIDLTYLPITTRQLALKDIEEHLMAIAKGLEVLIGKMHIQYKKQDRHVVKLVLSTKNAQIKIEPNTILRGSLYPSEQHDLCKQAQHTLEAFTSVKTLSRADLYGGKICAALDRQHPRDLFDIKLLLDSTGITPEIRKAGIFYLISHQRPISELLDPQWRILDDVFHNQFAGMTSQPVSLEMLVQAQDELVHQFCQNLSDDEKKFLLSFKQGTPAWDKFGLPPLDHYPAIKWKQLNIQKMTDDKHRNAIHKLEKLLFP